MLHAHAVDLQSIDQTITLPGPCRRLTSLSCTDPQLHTRDETARATSILIEEGHGQATSKEHLLKGARGVLLLLLSQGGGCC
jgi:predicted deacylase